jgi:hypothetical protein
MNKGEKAVCGGMITIESKTKIQSRFCCISADRVLLQPFHKIEFLNRISFLPPVTQTIITVQEANLKEILRIL